MAAGPRAEHSMILNPCSGGVVAIGPPVVKGRIVAAAARAPAAGPRHTGAVETEALDDALTVFAATAPSTARSAWPTTGPWSPRRWRTWAGRRHPRLGGALPRPPRRGAATGAPPPARRGVAGRARRGGALPRVARPLRARDRRPPDGRGRGRVGAASAARHRRGGDARADPHRSRGARPRRGRHAAAPARGRERAGLLGLELPGAPGPAAADRARGCGRRRWPTCPTSPRMRRPPC